METGLEKMRNIISANPNWELETEGMTSDGDMVVQFYNQNVYVDCFMYYEKDMDQEYYLYKIEFKDRIDMEE